MKNKNIKIEWLTKSPSMQSYFNGEKNLNLTGGILYEIFAINTLKNDFNISLNSNFTKSEKLINYFLKNHKKTINADVCIIDPYVLALGKFDNSKKNIAIIHHVDEKLDNNSLFRKVFFNRLISNLKRVDTVVVVSKFWKNYLLNRGVKNIEIIYNSYKVKDYLFDSVDIEKFRDKLGIDISKPIIYLGKNGDGKGIKNILDYINHSKYQLITTGKTPYPLKEVKTLYFTTSEFSKFLSICDVVLAMSTMPEGWNRIAHEALLVKTPVIGSGTGGMRELLKNSGQVIVEDLNTLEANIDKCIKESATLGKEGFKYVSQFDENYFESKWKSVINKVIN